MIHDSQTVVTLSADCDRPPKNVGKGENADNQHFRLFGNIFRPIKEKLKHLSGIFCCLQIIPIWYKILPFD